MRVSYDFGDMLVNLETRRTGMSSGSGDLQAICYGTEGTLVVHSRIWKVCWKDGSAEEGSETDAFTTRVAHHSGLDIECLSAKLRDLAAISCRLGCDLRFDPGSNNWFGDAEADTLLPEPHQSPRA